MTLLTIILVLWGASALINHARDRKRQAAVAAMKRAEDQRRADAARLRAEWKERERQAREEYLRVRRLEREQERLKEEQERQAVQLEKHEKRITALETKSAEAERKMRDARERANDLYGLLDYELDAQAAHTPGSKQHIASQRRIVSLNNQIRTAEERYEKAKSAKESAEAELSA